MPIQKHSVKEFVAFIYILCRLVTISTTCIQLVMTVVTEQRVRHRIRISGLNSPHHPLSLQSRCGWASCVAVKVSHLFPFLMFTFVIAPTTMHYTVNMPVFMLIVHACLQTEFHFEACRQDVCSALLSYQLVS